MSLDYETWLEDKLQDIKVACSELINAIELNTEYSDDLQNSYVNVQYIADELEELQNLINKER